MILRKRFYFVSIFMLQAFILNCQNLLNALTWAFGFDSLAVFSQNVTSHEIKKEFDHGDVGNYIVKQSQRIR